MTALAARLASTLQRLAQANHTYTETLANQRVRDGSALGFVELDSGGEAVAVVTFPMLFVERPIFTYGLELGESSYLTTGSFPLATACIAGWDTKQYGLSKMYSGATMGIYVTGVAGTAILHYCFQARSYLNPVGSASSVEAPI